jgi:hypothetical protein
MLFGRPESVVEQREIPAAICLEHVRFEHPDTANGEMLLLHGFEPGVDFGRRLTGFNKDFGTDERDIWFNGLGFGRLGYEGNQ